MNKAWVNVLLPLIVWNGFKHHFCIKNTYEVSKALMVKNPYKKRLMVANPLLGF